MNIFGPSHGTGGPNRKDQMHPQDMRNMILFFVIAGLMYFAFDAIVMKPQRLAIQQRRAAQATAEKAAPIAVPVKMVDPDDLLRRTPRMTLATPTMTGSISLEGLSIDNLAFNDYFVHNDKKEPVVLLAPQGLPFSRQVEFGWVSADKNLRLPGPKTLWSAQGNTTLGVGRPVTVHWNNGVGLEFKAVFTVDEQYMLTIVQTVINAGARPVEISPYSLIRQKALREDFAGTWIAHEGPVGFADGLLYDASYSGMRKAGAETFRGTGGWAGITDKYWLTAVIPAQDKGVVYRYSYAADPTQGKREKERGTFQVDTLQDKIIVTPGATAATQSHLFTGVKKVIMLKEYEHKLGVPSLDLAVDFGWFWFMTKPFFYALHYLAAFSGNFGIAIILLTVVIRSAVYPLTSISYKSFARMKKIGPQMAELRAAYGDDKPRLQSEIVALYEREQVNPMSGCFPVLLQIPIFFSLYKVLIVSLEMRHAPFFGWIQDLSAPDPTSVFNLFGLIPWEPPTFLHIGVWPCLMLTTMLIQKTLNPPPQDPVQRDMMNIMPFMMSYMMAKFASGLVIYWTFSGLIGLLQQMLIMKQQGVPIYLLGEREEEIPGVPERPAPSEPETPVVPKTVSAPRPRRKKKK